MTSRYSNPQAVEAELKALLSDESLQDVIRPEDNVRVEMPDITLPIGRPPLQDDCMLHGAAPEPHHPQVVMTQTAVDQIHDHCQSNTDVELGGVLLGRAYLNRNHTIYVQVEAAVPARNDDNGPVHFTFTADVWAQIHLDRRAYPELEVVGWFHTHPDLGVFYSADDDVVHAAAFTQPWHVGLVVDPIRHEASYFGWEGKEVVALPGFYELIPATSEPSNGIPRSVVKWEVTVDDSWYMPQMMAAAPPAAMLDDNLIEHPLLPLLISTISLAVSTVTLALIVYQFWFAN